MGEFSHGYERMKVPKPTLNRLRKELLACQKEPPPHIRVNVDESDILNFHFVIEGPSESPYMGGFYHGRLRFPPEYPFKPPAIMMHTPNGRFETDTRLCLSMSDFHPETWNPMWSVSTVLTGLLSFMLEDSPTTGAIETPVFEKKRLATQSLP